MTKDEIAEAADALNDCAKNMPTVPSTPWRTMLDGAEAIRQLQAENEALRKDAERIDWLQAKKDRFHNIDRISSVDGRFNGLQSLRAAIDAAMK